MSVSELQEKQLIKTIVCPAKISDFNPKLGASTLDYKSSIQSAKSAITKLSKNLLGYAPFYIVDNYFKDPITKKPIGPLLAMGKEKKVQKHFVMVEMKSGKPDQRSSANPKEAATGRIYAKQTETGIILCFEPHPKCKIPAPKWPKIFKSLKPCLKGFKCELVTAVVAQGVVDDVETEQAASSIAGSAELNTVPQQNLEQLVDRIISCIKVTLPNQVISNIKSKKLTGREMGIVTNLLKDMEDFKNAYLSAPAVVRTKLQSISIVVDKQYLAVQKLRVVLEGIQNIASAEPVASTTSTNGLLNVRLQQLLKEAETTIHTSQSNQQTRQATLAQNSNPPLIGGEALLNLI